MTLTEIKQQAIGKHIFVDWEDKGGITDIKRGFWSDTFDVITDIDTVSGVRKYHFTKLLAGKRVKQYRTYNGWAWHSFGYNFYEIREK